MLHKNAIVGMSTRSRSHQARLVIPIEVLESRVLFSVFWVSNANDNGAGSLRQAITQADALKGTQTIDFAVGKGAQTIEPRSALPALTTPIILDAQTQPGYTGTPLIQLDGALAGSVNGLVITAGGSTIKGLAVNHFSENGILGVNVGDNTVAGDYIGTDLTGSIKEPNGQDGILLYGGSNVVGGMKSGSRNVISGNGKTGLQFLGPATGKNLVQGNYMGTDVTGKKAVPNYEGVGIFNSSTGNLIGGLSAGAGNVISGNIADGVDIGSNDTAVEGDILGLTADGATKLANVGQNVLQIGSSGNTIVHNV